MKTRITFHVVIFLLFYSNSFSQKNNFTPGFYIKQNGDTVKGFLKIKSDNQIATFEFKKMPADSNSSVVYFDNCRELAAGSESFVNWSGTIHMTYIDKFDMAIKNPGKFNNGSFSLHLILKGEPLSLYYYRDLFDHYFVKKGDAIEELYSSYRNITDWEKSKFINNPPTYIVNPVFRDQITALIGEELTKRQIMLIENLEYDKQSLVKLFKSINKSKQK